MGENLQDILKKILFVVLWGLTIVVAVELGYWVSIRNPAPPVVQEVTVVVTAEPIYQSPQPAMPVVIVVTATPEPATMTATNTPITPEPTATTTLDADTPTAVPTDTPSPLPEYTATATELPAATATALPHETATAVPTQTPHVIVVVVTPTASATPENMPTATPEPFKYPAPRLLEPQNNWIRGGAEHPPTLEWESVGYLDWGEYYAVTIQRVWRGEVTFQGSDWITDTQFVPYAPIVYKTSDDDIYHWWVTVMRQTGTREDGGKVGVAISPESEHRRFKWE